MTNNTHQTFLNEAIALAVQSAKSDGGPFGAVIVKAGKIIGRGYNQVTHNCDPSAHAEIMAIREACQTLQSHQLDNCIIYSSCEPCPMCLSAIYWARIPELVYAATASDAAAAGFDDHFIYEELAKKPQQRQLKSLQLSHPDAVKSFQAWQANSEREDY